MALKIVTGIKDNIKVIVREDSSIPEDLSDEEWTAYVETLDETYLRLKDEPTRFVMRTTLPFEAQMSIRNAQLSYTNGKPEVKTGYMLEEVRCSLIGIENPPGAESFKFRKDDDGYAARELIADLSSYGLVTTLFILRNSAVSKVFTPTKK